MQALGGSFDILSAPGQGVTATLTLPLSQRETRPAAWLACREIALWQIGERRFFYSVIPSDLFPKSRPYFKPSSWPP